MGNYLIESASAKSAASITVFHDEEADSRVGYTFDDRYGYDFELALDKGWHQFDTQQDASYFGLWIDVIKLRTFCFCEGDRILDVYSNVEDFKKALDAMNARYGEAPPVATTLDIDEGKITRYLDERPSSSTYEILLAKSLNARRPNEVVAANVSNADI